ncbi:MAG TPA: hypothetical protein VGM92_06280 [Candidatus Kapabacteria bacterium]|jgi:hypothetical protein
MRELLWPLLVTFVARIAMVPFAHLDNPHLWEYGDIARQMLHGYGYAFHWSYRTISIIIPSAWMPPGQVFIQYLGLKLLGDNLSGYIFIFLEDVVIGSLVVIAMREILQEIFSDRRLIRFGTWLAALYPSFIFAASTFGIGSAVLTIDAFFLWALLATFRAVYDQRKAIGPAIGLGVSAGLLTQFRSESYLLIALTFILLAWQLWKKPDAVRAVAIAVAACAIVAAPWIVRNAVVFHRFLPTSTSGGFNFWRGHSPEATGSSWDADGGVVWTPGEMWDSIEPLAVPDTNIEFTMGRYHLQDAKAWIAAHPLLELERTLKKFVLLWGVDWYNPEAQSPIYILLYTLTLLCFVLGIIRARRTKIAARPVVRFALQAIALWCVFYTAIVLLFFSLPRLQILMIGFYFPLVVYGADEIVRKFWRNRKRSNSVISNHS